MIDQVLKFRQELWFLLKAEKKSIVTTEVIEEENVEGIGMPIDWFPNHWLPFVLYGKFSDNPVHIVDGSKGDDDKPLKDRVDSRVEVRVLSEASK